MSEGPPRPEASPVESGVDGFVAILEKGEWSAAAEKALADLIEKYPDGLYMLYLNYRRSGLVDEPDFPDHERKMYEQLERAFVDV